MKALLAEDQDFLRPLVQAVLQELLEAEMTEALGAEKGERTPARLGYRSGYYGRTLVTRVGKLELRVPQDRARPLLDRAVRALPALREGAGGGAGRDVRAGRVDPQGQGDHRGACGHSFSASAISAINVRLDEELAQFAGRRLDEACPYLIVDARYERVREAGVIRSQAVLLAIGIGWDGRRSILAVELANRESRSSWRDFLLGLRERGLSGVEFVVSDDHAGLRQAIVEVLPEAAWQRCYVHFLRNALDYVPRKVDDDCLRELRWLYDRRDLAEARRDLAAWLAKWQATYPKLCGWVEEHIEETLTLLPAAAPAPQAPEVDQPAGAPERGDQAAHPRRPHLPQCRKLLAADPGARGRDARELARSAPLPEHGRPARAQEGGPAHGGVTHHAALWTTLRVAHKGPPPPTMIHFAEDSGHNWGQLLPRIKEQSAVLTPTTCYLDADRRACHLKHRDHSLPFWNEVDKVLPRWREKKDWLRRCGAGLDL